MNTNKKKAFFALVIMLILGVSVAFAAPLAGAIFTTTPDGTIVNENVRYEDKREVYLDGGPPPNAPASAAGLPDGLYVFQVTDPSGKFLLSEDPAKCRIVRADGGVIVERVAPSTLGPGLDDTWSKNNGPNGTFPCHIDDNPPHPTDPGAMGASGRHDTNVDADHGADAGAIVVQLMPYGTTPNPGGVYKAWITPLDTYQAKGGNLNAVPSKLPNGQQKPHSCPDFCAAADPGFGPPHDQVKTDNFKAREVPFVPPEITVRKFHDLDGDGVWDEGEPEIGVDQCVDKTTGDIIACPGGWPYDFTEPVNGGTVTNEFFTPNTHVAAIAGTYTACESHLLGWMQSAAYLDGVLLDAQQCVDVAVAGTSGETHEIVFGNFRPAEKSGQKRNAETGAAVPGWEIHLFGTNGMGNAVHEHATTDAGGSYTFTGISPGSYSVCEEMQTGWTQTFPTGATPGAVACVSPHFGVILGPWGWAFNPQSGDVDRDNDFANAPPQGCTPGFWKTHSRFGPATGDHWPPTGLDPDDLVEDTFTSAADPPYTHLGDSTLLEALSFQGGDSLAEKAEILLRAAVAAVLNAAHPEVSYSFTQGDVIGMVNGALDSQDADTILVLAGQLDAANNLGCPLGGPTP